MQKRKIIDYIVAFVAGSIFFSGVAFGATSFTFQPSLIPQIDNTYTLGTTTKVWKSVYTNEICLSADCKTAWPSGGPGGTAADAFYHPTPTQSATTTNVSFYGNASSTQFTATSSVWFTSLTSALLATDQNGKLVATTTLGTNKISGSLGSINGVDFPVGTAITGVTAASSTLLTDNNTFSGNDVFSSTITGSVSGNAGTATALQNARTINGVSFNGTANITINAASSTLLANNNTFSGATTTFSNGVTFKAFSLNGTVISSVASPLTTTNGQLGCTTCNTSNASVSSIVAGTGLNGGTITTSGTISLTSYFGTSTADTAGQVVYWNTTNGTPAKFSSVATGTVSSSGGITTTASRYVLNGALSISCDVATASVPGCLAAADFATFASKITLANLYTKTTNFSIGVLSTSTVSWFTGGIQASSTSQFSQSSTTLETIGTLWTPGIVSAVVLTDSGGKNGAASTQTCTNQFFRVLSGAYAVTCASVADTDFTGQLGLSHGGTNASLSGANQILFMNSGNTAVSLASGFTFGSAGNLLTVTNASTTNLTASNLWATTFSQPIASSTDASAQRLIDWSAGNSQRLILSANTNLTINSTSSNPRDGAGYKLTICQDSTGSRTLTFTPIALRWGNGTTTISSGGGTCSMIGMWYDGLYSVYRVVASSTGMKIN